MKIFITGGGGYLGSILTRLCLDEGYHTIVMDNGYRNIDNLLELCNRQNFEFIKGDVLNHDLVNSLVKNADITIPMAALVGQPICDKYPALAVLINHRAICNIAKHNKPIIFPSTGSVYGELASICTEESSTNPVSLYAKTKIWAEEEIKNKNDNYIILRFATAYGTSPNTRLDLLINDLTYQAYKNKTITIFQADYRRTFCHAFDIANCILHSIKNFDVMKKNVYNVGTEDGNWTKRQLAEYLKKRTNCSIFYGEGYKDPDVRDYFCDFSRIKRMGWLPTYSIEKGIDELLKGMPLIKINNQYSVI